MALKKLADDSVFIQKFATVYSNVQNLLSVCVIRITSRCTAWICVRVLDASERLSVSNTDSANEDFGTSIIAFVLDGNLWSYRSQIRYLQIKIIHPVSQPFHQKCTMFGQVGVMMPSPLKVPIETSPVCHIPKALPFLVKRSLFAFPLNVFWVLKNYALNSGVTSLDPGQTLKCRGGYEGMAYELRIVTTHPRHLNNDIFTKIVLFRSLTLECKICIVRAISKEENHLYFHVTTALLNVIS